MKFVKVLCLISAAAQLAVATIAQGQAQAPPMSNGGTNTPATSGADTRKRIYLALDDHTDYMWTGDEEDYRRVFVEMLDYYLDQADKTKDAPPDYRSKFEADGSLWLKTYEEQKTPAQFRRLIDHVKQGSITFPLNTAVSTYGGTPTEAVLRGMYYAGSLERRFDFRVPMAIAMENQTLPFGLGALWAGSGAKYSWKGVCACLSEIDRDSPRPHELYWWVGQDGSRLLTKWNSRIGPRYGSQMGGYAEGRFPAKEIERVTSEPAFLARYPYNIVGVFGHGSDDLETRTDAFPRIARELTNGQRRVIVSNMEDFFVDVEKTYGNDLPSQSVGFGNEWDLYTASLQEVSSRVRRAVERLRPAEAMAALVTLQQPAFMAPRRDPAKQVWTDLGLYWEHDWTADSTRVPRQARANWGRKLAGEIEDYVNSLHRDAAYQIGGMIRSETGKQRFYVFNPLGWRRTDAADIAYDSAAPIHIVDVSSGADVPFQILSRAETGFPNGRRYLRILASDLPPVGYKVYEIRDGAGRPFDAAAKVADGVIENSVYRIKVEPRGAITSWIDKRRGNVELAGSLADGRWSINDLGYDPAGDLTIESAGPVSVTLKATGSSPLSHVSHITLFRDSNRVDLVNEITQGFDGTHVWGFVFNLDRPDVHHEEVGAIAHARLSTDGGDYSPVMSRLDWLTLNHFADMTGKSPGADEAPVGVTLSNMDLAFMRMGRTAIHNFDPGLDTRTPQIQVLAGGQIDAPTAGIPNQGGDTHFLQRFALESHGTYDPVDSMRFALEHQNPPVVAWVQPGGTLLPATDYSMLGNSNPNVLLWALKPAEDGPAAGIVARVWNVATSAQDYRLSLTGGVRSAVRATHIETDLEPLPVTRGAVTGHATGSQIQTVRLVPAKATRR